MMTESLSIAGADVNEAAEDVVVIFDGEYNPVCRS